MTTAVVPERGLGAAGIAAVAAVAAIEIGEAVFVAVGPLPGAVLDAVLVLVLVNAALVAPAWSEARLLAMLGLVPLGRIFDVVMPLGQVSRLYWPALAAAPLLVALVAADRSLGLSLRRLCTARGGLGVQGLVALAAVPAGLVGWALLRPAPLAASLSVRTVAVGSAVLLASAAAEELLFRGILQDAAAAVFGDWGLVVVGVLFAATYVGWLSVGYVILVGVGGLGLGLTRRRTGSIWGAVLAHALFDIGVLLVWPALFGS